MNKTIAIVEDDLDILKLIAITMEKSGFKAEKFSTGKDFLDYVGKKLPDLVILDLMLPDMDGLEICKYMRQNPKTRILPILILTAKGEEVDKVVGLELGADDYVTKPFSLRELVARVKAILRRKEAPIEKREITIGEILKIEPIKYEVFLRDNKIELTTTEFKLLLILAENKDRVFSREELLDRLWGREKIVVDRTIDVHVKKLRDKLGVAGKFIKSIRGIGYKLEE